MFGIIIDVDEKSWGLDEAPINQLMAGRVYF